MRRTDQSSHELILRRWDIFCRVVDNFGDIGVCWRLAHQLSHEQGRSVRLWTDDLKSLKCLVPETVLAERQRIHGVDVHHWTAANVLDATPADVVIDAFGCGVPERYAHAMAARERQSLWIILEYLTAEPWSRGYHAMPSPHPRLPLARYFFFPGFTAGTGGLLFESDTFARQNAFGAAQGDAFWRSIAHEPPPPQAFTVSVFSYEHAPLLELLSYWESGSRQVVVAIPESTLESLALQHFGANAFPASRVLHRRMLEVRLIPFIPQVSFDHLLWSCDFNFVRGEDSFVRAQWAGAPFVWHVYPQSEDAHIAKLDAFIALYCRGLSEPARDAVRDMMYVWNGAGATAHEVGRTWAAFASHSTEIRRHASVWRAEIAAVGSLADNLASFCQDKLK